VGRRDAEEGHLMGWSLGYDSEWGRDIGYGVPAMCDHPGCGASIDRGLAHVCGGEPYGGERGCGLYFCGKHLSYYGFATKDCTPQLCDRCGPRIKKPFAPTPDVPEWLTHKLTDPSWATWRRQNRMECKRMKAALDASVKGVSA
jgi:hypothetical protein